MGSERLSTEELELRDLLDQVLLTVGTMVRALQDKSARLQEDLARSQRGFEMMFADLSKARAEIRKLTEKS